jgi:hypothetical protein
MGAAKPDRPGARSNFTALCLCIGDSRQKWEKWGSWSSCSASCGQGVETRYRFCGDTSSSTGVCKVRHEYVASFHAHLIIRDHKLLLASACLPFVPVFSQVLHLHHHHHLLHAQHQSMEPPHVYVDAPTSFTPKLTKIFLAVTSTLCQVIHLYHYLFFQSLSSSLFIMCRIPAF